MSSKTSCFNPALFKKTVSRFWPVWTTYLGILLVSVPLSLAERLSWSSETNYMSTVQNMMYNSASKPIQLLSFAFAIISAMAVFSYLYNAKSVGMMASLPIKREGMFITQMLAGIVPILASDVVVFLATLAVEAAYGAVDISSLALWLGAAVLTNITFYGFAVLCAQLTGHLVVLPCVYIVLSFTVWAVENMVRVLLSYFIYGMYERATVLNFFSPLVNLMDNVGTEYVYDEILKTGRHIFTGWGLLGIYAALGVVCAVGALLLYKHRRMETASDVVAVKALKPVLKYCMAFGGALVMCIIISSIYLGRTDWRSACWIVLFMVIGGFIGYFVAEMLLRKTLRFWTGGWKGWIIFTAIVLVLIGVCEFDPFGFETYIPDNGEIEYVNVICNGNVIAVKEPENIASVTEAHRSVISHKEDNEKALVTFSLRITYMLKNGKTVERRYNVARSAETGNEDVELLEAAMNTREAIHYRKRLNGAVTPENIVDPYVTYTGADGEYVSEKLTAEEMYELYTDCIVPDMNDECIGRVWLETDEEYLDTVYDCTVNFEIKVYVGDSAVNAGVQTTRPAAVGDEYTYYHFYTTPTKNSTRTTAWLKAHGIEPATLAETEKYEQGRYSDQYNSYDYVYDQY